MNSSSSFQRHLVPGIQTAFQFKFLILGCVTFCTLGGVIFALLSPKVYQASQPFLVRDEISGQFLKPGRFESVEAMKSAQETIQQITKNPDVLRNALEKVGPSSWFAKKDDYPTFEDIEGFRDNVWISAANGSELGKTEVIQLNVRSTSRERAYQLIEHIGEGVRAQLREVRSRRAASIEAELTAALETAQSYLAETTERVVAMEVELGEDLSELRTLENPSSGEGSLRPSLVKVQTELLTNQTKLDEVNQQIRFFKETLESPEQLTGVPNELLQQFPALGTLKLGLVQAKLDLARISGQYNQSSAQIQQAHQQIETIKQHVHDEIATAVDIALNEKAFVESRLQSLREQQEGLKTRIQRLAKRRAPYANLLAEMKVASEQVRIARTEYSEAVALQRGSEQTDLITQLEQPEVGSQPVSVSRSKVVLGSLGGGVFLSLGLVMLLTAPGQAVSPEQLEELARQRDQQTQSRV